MICEVKIAHSWVFGSLFDDEMLLWPVFEHIFYFSFWPKTVIMERLLLNLLYKL
jgi:hypothetical protein